MNKTILLGIIFLLIPLAFAIQPTQEYNKIYLNPFYRAVMNSNINYNYNLSINTPDGISNVLSAIITIDSWSSPTDTINLTVNGKSCNNPSYTIPTGFGSGKYSAIFDCSNIITSMGNYSIIVRHNQSSNFNDSSATAWIDLTYMNNPSGDLKISGTEYSPNDYGRVFLQLLDSNKAPIINSSCYTSIVYPNLSIMVNASLMSKSIDGLYFYDINPVPSILGVYMVSSYCSVPSNTLIDYTDDFECGGLSCGSSNWNSSWIQTSATISAGSTYAIDSYSLMVSGEGYRNFTVYNCSGGSSAYITFWATTQGLENGRNCYYDYWNGTGYTVLLNLNNTNSVANDYHYYSYDICKYTKTYGIKNIDVNKSTSGGKLCYIDDVDIALTNSIYSSQYQILRGSGELHVTNMPSAVWNYTTRTLTTTENYTNEVTAIWNATNRTLTYYPDNTTQILTSIQNNSTNIINNLLTINTSLMTSILNIPSLVWSYITRNLTYYPSPVINTTSVTIINTTLIVNTTQVTVQNVTNNLTVNNYSLTVNNSYPIINVNNYSVNTQVVNVQNVTTNITVNNTYVTVNNYSLTVNNSYPVINVNNYTVNTTQVTLQNYSLTVNNSYPIINVNNYSVNTEQLNVTVNNTYVTVQNYSLTVNNSYPQIIVNNYSVDTQQLNITVNTSINYLNNYTVNVTNTLVTVDNYSIMENNSYPVIQTNNYTVNVTNVNLAVNNYSIQVNNTYPVIELTNYSISNNVTVDNYTIQVNNTYPNIIVNNYSVNTQVVNVQNVTVNVSTQNVVVNNLTENVSAISDSVWNADNRSLTYYPPQIDMTNYSYIQQLQYNYTDRFNSIDANLSSIISMIVSLPYDIWNYISRTLTYYPNPMINTTDVTIVNTTIVVNTSDVTVDNYTLQVNNSYPHITVQNYTVELTNYSITNNVTVDNYTIQVNNTYPFIELTNYSISNNVTVDNYTIQVNNTYPIITVNNYTVDTQNVSIVLNETYVTVQNITQNNTDMTNYSRISYDVWHYIARYTHGVII